jgi:hypothetical protein
VLLGEAAFQLFFGGGGDRELVSILRVPLAEAVPVTTTCWISWAIAEAAHPAPAGLPPAAGLADQGQDGQCAEDSRNCLEFSWVALFFMVQNPSPGHTGRGQAAFVASLSQSLLGDRQARRWRTPVNPYH